jgi:hypothetical protein
MKSLRNQSVIKNFGLCSNVSIISRSRKNLEEKENSPKIRIERKQFPTKKFFFLMIYYLHLHMLTNAVHLERCQEHLKISRQLTSKLFVFELLQLIFICQTKF